MSAEEDDFGDWVRDVWTPSITIIAGAFQEATGCTEDDADHFANAVLARLVDHDPPITVRAMAVE